jgi:hypothetical protein
MEPTFRKPVPLGCATVIALIAAWVSTLLIDRLFYYLVFPHVTQLDTKIIPLISMRTVFLMIYGTIGVTMFVLVMRRLGRLRWDLEAELKKIRAKREKNTGKDK